MTDKQHSVILTIDDEKNIRQSFRLYLEDYNYQVLEAEHGAVGIEMIERHSPDLVLVDLRMPDVDGLDVLKHISESTPRTPVIVVSGTGVIADAVEALRRGAWDYLLKPIEDMNILLHTVETTLERARFLDEKRKYREHLEAEVQERTAELLAANTRLMQEIEQRARAEVSVRESEEKLRNILESSPFGMHVYQLDDKDRLLFIGANPAADWILHVDHSKYAGRAIEEVYPVLFKDDVPPQLYRIIAMGETTRYEQQVNEIAGTSRIYDIHAYKAAEGIMVCNVIDISERAKAGSEREKLISILEAKNAELERFTYTVSHDLKTPLITIRGFLELLDDSLIQNDMEEARKCINRINHAASSMEELLRNLLSISRIDHNKTSLTAFNVRTLIEDVLELFERQIEERGIRVSIGDELSTVTADRNRIFEVYQNLLENAIYFSDGVPGPEIEIGLRGDTKRQIFYVKDNGIGIEPAYHKKVFHLFEKLDKDSDGTGIGLALVKRIIEAHAGTVWVESEGDGKGTTICFTLQSVKEAEACQASEINA